MLLSDFGKQTIFHSVNFSECSVEENHLSSKLLCRGLVDKIHGDGSGIGTRNV